MNASDVRDAVRGAAAQHTTVRITGSGTWLDAGRPVRATSTLSLASLTGVVHYEPGDFTLTARAGTTLAELARATLPHRQFLALDPFGDPNGTLGATVATGANGPMAYAFGGPRDNVIGMEVVTGDGAIVGCGGRVVKNVAGFDLARLMTGAWGTLGAITEVTVRLRAKPEVDRTLAVAIDGGNERACDDAGQWLRATPYRPLAAELCSPALSERIGLEGRTLLLVRLGGNDALVHAAGRAVAELGSTKEIDATVWSRLRVAEPNGAAVVRLGTLPASAGALWDRVVRVTTGAGGWSHATVPRGVVRCILPPARTAEEIERLRGIMKELHAPGSCIVERAPAPLWADIPSAVADRLSRDVRRTFDPDRVLNPGILDHTA
jgi:glycolate oxidase FAD binding subunit